MQHSANHCGFGHPHAGVCLICDAATADPDWASSNRLFYFLGEIELQIWIASSQLLNSMLHCRVLEEKLKGKHIHSP